MHYWLRNQPIVKKGTNALSSPAIDSDGQNLPVRFRCCLGLPITTYALTIEKMSKRLTKLSRIIEHR